MIRILLADDHVLFREGLKQILGKHRDLRVVDEAGSGTEAMEKILNGRYDVIILDISMPGRSGLDILGEIRTHHPDLPVLILSMHPEEQYAVRVLRAGAAGYLTKESAAAELITAIRKVAAGGRYISPAVAERLAEAMEHGAERAPHQLLSNREDQVMRMLASGKSLREIADDLFLSEKTITTYRARILEKMKLRNNVELTHYAITHKLLDSSRP
ncbi:MAG: response regulator transcription factor [Bacteroidetes bacterium]|nr:response regulator transcription factor [Bacteroidota bacterium]